MQAWFLTGPGALELREVPDPQPGPHEAVVRVEAVGICGSDVHVYRGRHPYTPYPVVQGHEFFERRGEDVLCEIPISYSQAALGAKLKVPTLSGSASMKIPPGTQTHTIFRLAGKGLPRFGTSGTGDQYVKVVVKTPTKINRKMRKLLEEMQSEESKSTGFSKFFDKLKK